MMHLFQNYLLLNVYSKPREQQQQKRIKISNIILQQILIKRACWKIKMKHSYFKCLGENTHFGKIYHWENCLVYQPSDWTDFTYQQWRCCYSCLHPAPAALPSVLPLRGPACARQAAGPSSLPGAAAPRRGKAIDLRHFNVSLSGKPAVVFLYYAF